MAVFFKTCKHPLHHVHGIVLDFEEAADPSDGGFIPVVPTIDVDSMNVQSYLMKKHFG